MARFGIIADDLTGASDVGIQFKKRGLETVVLTDVKSLEEVKNCDVIVVDTESRNETSRVAYKKVRDAVRGLKDLEVEVVYKKIDSTLRGNIGAELDAVMDELGSKAAIVAPAFPATGRTTVNGRQLVGGIPLEETEFARDPLHPIKVSHIPTLIGSQARRRVGVISLTDVRDGIGSLKREIQSQIWAGREVIVVDAETPADLMVIAKAALDFGILPCGSAGLAEGVSYWLSRALQKGRLLTISGSVNSVTLDQIQAAERVLNVKVLEPNILRILEDIKNYEADLERIVKEAAEAFAQEEDVTIRLAGSKEAVLEVQRFGCELGMDKLETARRILSFLGKASKKLLDDQKIAGLILVGGDTAIEVMKSIGACGIRIEGEVLPGVPLGRMIGGRFEGLPTVTKAGGFGREDALIICMRKLKDQSLSLGPLPSTM
ncbi:MAG: four-carbon acid sugar kinase family protein [Candidatus Bathyarchaeia archaeon]